MLDSVKNEEMSFNEFEKFPEFKSYPAKLEQGEACEVRVVVRLDVLDGKIIQEELCDSTDSLIHCAWEESGPVSAL
jgi:hypothetical protein